MSKGKITYFPGLHALRFFAATMVIFHHVEQYKSWAGISNSWGNNIIDSLGHLPVSFFFVLSGFLITYLLLVENKKHGNISLGQFYWRRVLRIWPLYFVIVAAALFIVPAFAGTTFDHFQNPLNSPLAVFGLILFLPNLLRIGFPDLVGGNQLWSVGIEEQFYLFWPLLVGKFVKNIIPFLIIFIAIKFFIHVVFIFSMDLFTSVRLQQVVYLYKLFPVEQMAVGGLGASFLFHQKHKILQIITHPLAGVLAVVVTMVSAIYGWHHWMISYLQAILFTVIIFQVISHKVIYTLLEKKFFTHLGNISYGIYMWHTIAIAVIITLLKWMNIEMGTVGNLLLYGLSIAVTIGVAHLSYQFMEKPFLKLKNETPRSLFVKYKLRKQTLGECSDI